MPKQSPWVPDGTMFVASIKKTLHAEKLKPGDPVEFNSLEATLIGGKTVVPANAVLHGRVVEAQAANRETKQESRLAVMVESVSWKNKSVPVCATITGFGSREFKYDSPGLPVPAWIRPQFSPDETMNGAKALNTQSYAAANAVELSDRGLASVKQLPDAFTTPEPVTVRADGFVKGMMMYRSASGATVLTKKDKSIDLPGGLLVAIRQLQGTENGCPVTIVP